MKNLKFLTKILTSEDEYWMVAKGFSTVQFGRTERAPDQIILISIPRTIPRGIAYDEITLKQIEQLQSACVDTNIFVSESYPPFQWGISFHDIYDGFPVTKDIHRFMLDALAIKSSNLYDYKKLITTLNHQDQ